MGRRRAAAAADDGDAGGDEAARVGGHVLGRAEVDVAPFHERGRARVGHRRELRALRRAAAIRWTVSSIGCGPWLQFAPIDPDSERLEGRDDVLGLVAVEGRAVVVEGQGDGDGKVRDRAHRREGGLRLLEGRHRLDHEEVDAAVDESLGLLAVGRGRVLGRHAPDGLEVLAYGSDRPGHERLASRGLTRDPRPLAVDGEDLLLQAVGAELEAVGAEGVRLDDVDACGHVLFVDAAHEGGVREVQLVEASIEEDALVVEHRPHGTVADDHALAHALEKRLRGSLAWAWRWSSCVRSFQSSMQRPGAPGS